MEQMAHPFLGNNRIEIEIKDDNPI